MSVNLRMFDALKKKINMLQVAFRLNDCNFLLQTIIIIIILNQFPLIVHGKIIVLLLFLVLPISRVLKMILVEDQQKFNHLLIQIIYLKFTMLTVWSILIIRWKTRIENCRLFRHLMQTMQENRPVFGRIRWQIWITDHYTEG